MDYDIDPEIEKHADWIQRVENANRFLARLADKLPLSVKATWKLVRNTPAGTGLLLEVSIAGDTVRTTLTASEMSQPTVWQDKLDMLWSEALSSAQSNAANRISQLLMEWKHDLSLAGEGV